VSSSSSMESPDLIEFAVELGSAIQTHLTPLLRKYWSPRQAIFLTRLGIGKIVTECRPLTPKELIALAQLVAPPDIKDMVVDMAFRVIYGADAFLDDESDEMRESSASRTQRDVPQASIPQISMSLSTPQSQTAPTPEELQRLRRQLQEALQRIGLSRSVVPDGATQRVPTVRLGGMPTTSTPRGGVGISDTPPPDSLVSQVRRFMETLQKRLTETSPEDTPPEERLQQAQLRVAFDIVGGRRGIMQHGVTDMAGLMELARKTILQHLPMLSPEELAAAAMLGMAPEIRALTTNDLIRRIADILDRVSHELGMSVEELLQELESAPRPEKEQVFNAAQAYQSILERMGLDEPSDSPGNTPLKETLDRLSHELRQSTGSLDDILRTPSPYLDMPPEEARTVLHKALEESARRESPLGLIRKAHHVDELLGSHLADRAYSEILRDPERKRQLLDQTPEEAIENAAMCREWASAMQQIIDQHSDKMSWSHRARFMNRLQQFLNRYGVPEGIKEILRDQMRKELERLIAESQTLDQIKALAAIAEKAKLRGDLRFQFSEWVKQQTPEASTKEALTDLIETAKANGWSIDVDAVRDRGTELGMTPAEIARLIGDLFEYIRSLIREGIAGVTRLSPLIEALEPTTAQFDTLRNDALQYDSAGGLGALLNHDMAQALGEFPEDKKELLQRALSAGWGENLVFQWYLNRDRVPDHIRDMVKENVRRVTIEYGRRKASQYFGSVREGRKPRGPPRQFRDGDSVTDIIPYKSMVRIISRGKTIAETKPEDFLVRDGVSGKELALFVVDVSGSMTGEPLAAATLAVATLVHAFRRDELGLAIFESNTHVVKNVGDFIDPDELIDFLLDVDSMGGTMLSGAISWAQGQVDDSPIRNRVCIIATDAIVADLNDAVEGLQRLKELDTDIILATPHDAGATEIQTFVEEVGLAHLPIDIAEWQEFPQRVVEVLIERQRW